MGWPSRVWQAPLGPLSHPDLDGTLHADIALRDVGHDTVVLHAPPYWHERLGEEAEGKLLVAFTTYETDRLPDEWLDVLGHFDRVLVPSRFNADTFTASGLKVPVEVVPHIAPTVGTVALTAERRARKGTFVVYVIATWSSRKAILDSVEAFVRAFSAADDVVLVIHTTPEDLVALARVPEAGFVPRRQGSSAFALARALAGRDNAPRIVLSTRTLPAAEIAALHRRGDCFLSLSRGEGWGLGAFEAAAWGNPVIATGWGATAEFLPDGYPYLVEYDLVPTTFDEPDTMWRPRPGERWARARIGHAAAVLRRLYEDADVARDWGARAQAHVHANFDGATVTGRLLGALGIRADARDAPAVRQEPEGIGAPGEPDGQRVSTVLDRRPTRIYGRWRRMALRPKKSEGLDINEVEDGLIVYQESTDRVHHLNPTAAVILELCDGTRTAPEIARLVADTFGLDDPPERETVTCLEEFTDQQLIS